MALQHPPAPLPQPSAHGFLPTIATGLTTRTAAAEALKAVIPEGEALDSNAPVLGLSVGRSEGEWTLQRKP